MKKLVYVNPNKEDNCEVCKFINRRVAIINNDWHEVD